LHLIELTSRPELTSVNYSSKQGYCDSAQVHCCELQTHIDQSRIQRSNQYAVQRKESEKQQFSVYDFSLKEKCRQ
jgi:hypothetical protein